MEAFESKLKSEQVNNRCFSVLDKDKDRVIAGPSCCAVSLSPCIFTRLLIAGSISVIAFLSTL